ncbi:hypothetical protein GUJ93_ZPchr0005g14770 [Zizania palustris]|uniref:DCD domain-containing protein n=2 Tax=Zizania palustris TaxID=103762 RepID=A0A8J5T3D3_ZIZPA|nr:hypothetical protein GUJ93_ZPchr0005g14770 [Zizania palustris]
MQGHHLNSQPVDIARNLRENQLGGVIFGCKHNTIQECLEKQLFGLPTVHYSYVRNVKPGLPLFLFNYSDRRLHGIFEAASPGQMCIDSYAWNNDGSLRTPFPSQVRICTRTHYTPLLESQFRTVISDNYYSHHHFYFELDHAQTKALIALFKSLGPANIKQIPAVSSKTIPAAPSTKRQASVIPNQKKGSANSRDINSFSVLSHSSGVVPDNWGDSDADNGSISRTSDEKESGELVSDWEDLDDNVGICSNSDEISQNSLYNTVSKGMELVECSHLVVNPVNCEIGTSDGDMHVSSHDVHSGTVSVGGLENEVQNEPVNAMVQLPERQSILHKLKELFVLRQQAELSDQNLIYACPDQHLTEETQFNARLSCPTQDVSEETQINASFFCPDQHVPEETQINASLPCPHQHVPEETQLNASLSCPTQAVPEETHVTACISSPDQHATQSNASLSNEPFSVMLEGNASLEQHQGNAELMKIIADLVMKTEALDKRQSKSCEEILSLREVVEDSGTKVKQLEYRIDELQFKLDSSLSLLGGACNTLDKPSIFLIGGYNGVTWLSSLDSFSPEKDVLVPLTPMSSARSYASVAALDGCIFVFGGGDGSSWFNTVECYNAMCNEWMVCPCLNNKKGSLGGVSLNGKIYAVGGGDGAVTFSDVEMFDPYLGKWTCSPSMLNSRFALAVAEMNSVIYAAGGYDGSKYLQSAERYDPREGFWARLPSMNARRGCHTVAALGELLYAIGGYDGNSMVSSVEIYDPRRNSWRIGDPMSFPRGYASTVTLGDNLFVIGGLQSNEKILDTVEVYSLSSGWSIPGFSSIGKRCFASAAVV